SEEFLAQQLRDYELGRRHLANMMGEDEESFTQEHIDKAIEYLFPSGLFEKRARPIMKHPEQIFPKQKVIQWGEDGRPFHYLFYTGKPNYYSLQDLYSQLLQVEAEEDKMRSKAVRRALPSSRWVTQEELEQSLNEQLSEHDYARFVRLGERIASQPFPTEAAREQLSRFRVALQVQSQQQEIPERRVDEEGRAYSEANGFRKKARAKVTLWESGSGKITVNGLGHVDYFPQLQDREVGTMTIKGN
uniref:Mitochondrial ribosomal protein S9 n=1 Tax=Petromyzon marinus TaxID=7757 RepID=S4RY35_PETMA